MMSTCCLSVCKNTDIELVFLVDSSSKNPPNEWATMLTYVNSIIASYTVGSNSVRVGFVRYGDNPDVQISLNSGYSASQLATFITNIQYLGSSSANLAAALDMARSSVFASNVIRQGKTLIAIIVTDRLPSISQTPALSTAVQNAKNYGITIVGVGVTNPGRVDTGTLQQIVSNNYYTTVQNYNQLSTTVQQVALTFACFAPTVVVTTTPSPTSPPGMSCWPSLFF
jgi:hypothetical protein